MLKHAHNPSIEIRHIIKEEEKKLAVCLSTRWSFIFFSFSLSHSFSLNVKIEEQNSGRRSRRTQHDDLWCTIDRSQPPHIIIALDEEKVSIFYGIEITTDGCFWVSVYSFFLIISNFFRVSAEFINENFVPVYIRSSSLLFELEICLCCNNKLSTFRVSCVCISIYTYIGKEINRASSMIYISMVE